MVPIWICYIAYYCLLMIHSRIRSLFNKNTEKHELLVEVCWTLLVFEDMEKMAGIVKRYVSQTDIDTIYLCGGTCCLTGIEAVFEKVTGIRTVKPANPFLVTPAGIAMNCKI